MSDTSLDKSMQGDSAGSESNDVVYPLGTLEGLFRYVYERFQGEGAGALTVQINGMLSEKRLQVALAMLQKRHPRLRARFGTDSNGSPCFLVSKKAPPIPLEIKDFQDQKLPWKAEAMESVSKLFDTRVGPLCRVKVLRDLRTSVCELIICCHHAIVDATSVFRLVGDLLSYYDDPTSYSAEDGTVVDAVESLPFVPAFKPPITSSLLHRTQVGAQIIKAYMQRRSRAWITLPNDSAEYVPRWSRRILSSEETSGLVKRCRQEKIPTYGAIFAAAVSSLAKCLHDRPLRFACRLPIDLRQLPAAGSRVSNEDLGLFVSGFDKVYKIKKPISFWEMAKVGCADMQQFIAKQGPAMALRLLPVAERLSSLASNPPMRGTMSIDYAPATGIRLEYNDLSVDSLSFIFRNKFFGVSLFIGAVTVKGRLNFSMGAVDVTEELQRNFHDGFFEILRKVIRGQEDNENAGCV
jgi:hypothetical protein